MDAPQPFTDHLDALSDALDGSGDDLRAILDVLIDDLKAAVPSFVGLSVTVDVDGHPLTVQAMTSPSAGASMLLPLQPLTGLSVGSHLIFYARHPGAFAELAADTRAVYGLDGDVVLDAHLPAPERSQPDGTDTLRQRSEIDQAIGVLIDQGHPPEHARTELYTRAAAAGCGVHDAARHILHQLDSADGSGRTGQPADPE